MTTRERTAYPRFKQTTTDEALSEFLTPTDEEMAFVRRHAHDELPRLRLTAYLKSFQKLDYMP